MYDIACNSPLLRKLITPPRGALRVSPGNVAACPSFDNRWLICGNQACPTPSGIISVLY